MAYSIAFRSTDLRIFRSRAQPQLDMVTVPVLCRLSAVFSEVFLSRHKLLAKNVREGAAIAVDLPY